MNLYRLYRKEIWIVIVILLILSVSVWKLKGTVNENYIGQANIYAAVKECDVLVKKEAEWWEFSEPKYSFVTDEYIYYSINPPAEGEGYGNYMGCSLSWGGIKTFAGFEVNEDRPRVYDVEVELTLHDYSTFDRLGTYVCWDINECKLDAFMSGEREGWID